jgi:hypothetical protein
MTWASEHSDWLGLIQSSEDGSIAVLKVTVDESGTHGDAPIMAVAFCIGTKRQWGLFASDWRPIYTKELGENPYHAKLPICRDRLNAPLSELMWRRLDHHLVLTINRPEYKEVTGQVFRSQIGAAYTLLVQAGLFYLARWSERNSAGRLAYLLEAGCRGESHVDKIFKAIMANPGIKKRCRLASYTWAGKEEPELHPADLLSHETTTCYGGEASPILKRLSKHTTVIHMGTDTIEQALREIEEFDPSWAKKLRGK